MANAEEEGGCVTLTWEIENFGLLLATEKGYLESPVWKVEHTGGSAWGMLLVYRLDSGLLFSVDRLKANLPLDRCKMSLISSCGEVSLERNCKGDFLIEINPLFGEKRQSILPNDTLTLHCRMWKKTIRTREYCIYSVLNSVNYLWNIENFDSFCFYETYIEKANFLFYVSLTKKSGNSRHTVTVKVPYAESFLSFVHYALSIKDGQGRVADTTCSFPYVKWICDIEIFSENTSINLQLESIVALHKVCQDQLKLRSPRCSGVLCDDLLHLYRESALSDATLNTDGKSFSAHRSILAARSPVFRAMFEKDEMSEGRTGVVDIDDVDSETVDRMLVFLYGDSLEGVQWEEASALYYAADKYAVLCLKQKCVDLLNAGLTVDKVCNALVLADKHSDRDLMKCVVDFIRDHQEVFSSSEWEKLEENIPRLTTKILREVYVRKKECK